jgi:hypothetical protein
MMEAIYSSETSVDFQQATRRCIPEDSTFHNHRCENLKSYNMHNDLYYFRYDRESVHKSRMESKTAVMDVIGFLCVSPGSSTAQFYDRLGSRRACSCSEAGFSSQNGDRT